jgi:hypothetical protein
MSTNINVTVNTILQLISDLRGESSTNTDALRIRAVSRANQDFALRKNWRFYLMPNQSTTGTASNDYTIGSATYPMRYKGLSEVFVSDSTTQEEDERHDIVDFHTYKERYNTNQSDQMVYEWYDKANDVWKMHINPAPEATDTVYYSYYWEPPVLTATTDYVVCPKPRIIALMASAEIHDSEEERDTAKEEKNEAEQLILEVTGLENMPHQNQLYVMGSLEGSGIGNY